MKWLNRFGLPAKFTLILTLSVFVPLILLGFYSFDFAKESEKKFGINIYKQFADVEAETTRSQLSRLKSEILILGNTEHVHSIIKFHAEHPNLSSEELMKFKDYKDLFDYIAAKFSFIMTSNSNLMGIGLFTEEKNILAINENINSHEITIKANVPINQANHEKALSIIKSAGSVDGIWHFNQGLIFPFDKETMHPLDSIFLYFGTINSKNKKNIPFGISFFVVPSIKIKNSNRVHLLNPEYLFSLLLKENKNGEIEPFNPDWKNSQDIKSLIMKLPKEFLNANQSEFIDKNGNIYTIRKVTLGLMNLEKLTQLSFYPAKLIKEPFEEIRHLVFRILGLCFLFAIPILYFSIKTLLSDLRSVTIDLNNTSDTLEKSTQEIQKASSSIKKSNYDNKNRLNEISESVEKLAPQNQLLEKEILEMKSLSNKTSNSAIEGKSDLNEITITMDKIIESSKNISKITNIIENISMQTNILSMNASVEAARAGEHGKGFAVVAEAIRSLAQKSSQSAADIGKQIQESIEISGKGSIIASQNTKKFKEIIENIEKLNIIVDNSSNVTSNRIQEIAKIGEELKKINLAVAAGSVQTDKHEEIAFELSKEANSLRTAINKISTLLEGLKKQ